MRHLLFHTNLKFQLPVLQVSEPSVYVVVQFYPWFKFSFLLFQTHYHVIIIHYHTQKQKKRKFEPRIKLNHNIYTVSEILPLIGFTVKNFFFG